MRLIIVRHGDPDYDIDSLTKTGWEEAKLAAEKLSKMDIRDFYVSPLGRAQDTASCTLQKMNRTAETLDWLREFNATIKRPDLNGEDSIVWDWLPKDWTIYPEFYNIDTWLDNEIIKAGDVREKYEKVCTGLDELLTKYGYVREEKYYRAVTPNNDTIVFFCHFGLECVLLSHLLNISPMLLWHGFCAAPTSMTTIYTEERREGIDYFRASTMGDVSHLYIAGKEPSFSARFCECYSNKEERHD